MPLMDVRKDPVPTLLVATHVANATLDMSWMKLETVSHAKVNPYFHAEPPIIQLHWCVICKIIIRDEKINDTLANSRNVCEDA